ncbi:MAG: ATP-binding cassette domain-containing protein [Candidatus Dormibacteraeota bacterium]|nr:ATP-binding cassette domain-containing protein [Candidatus Dormibacteraeota bacterium]
MMLRVRGLRSGYGSSEVVHGVDLEVGQGEIVGMIGRNGMGKTTLLKAIIGLLPRWEGTVELASRDVTRQPAHRVIRNGIAYVPQEEALFGSFTVAENLQAALLGGAGSREALDEAADHFPFLRERTQQRAGTLSGGEQRMLLLARALAAVPRLLVIDEVCDGLHPPVVRRVVEVLSDYRRRHGMSVLIVEPNLRAVLELADRVLVMKSGRIVLERERADQDARTALERELVFT